MALVFNERSARLFKIIAVVYILIVPVVILTPILHASHLCDSCAMFIHYVFKYSCHQSPFRSFFILDYKMPVCARCLSIHVGIALTFIYLWKKIGENRVDAKITLKRIGLILLLIAPTAIDGGTQYLGWRESTNIIRLILGFPAGVAYALAVFFGLGLAEKIVEKTKKKVWGIIPPS
ncbi:MAG TPA: DUF2085 domain-containing protein [Candidatus Altiarchaeales archaeon]|nr:DUF2085 domain-containing protein [Candidatus Altiarchaeales archaeon]